VRDIGEFARSCLLTDGSRPLASACFRPIRKVEVSK
jgi:hypothetical protein